MTNLRGAAGLVHGGPLQPGWESGPAASAQPALGDLLDHSQRLQLGDGVEQSLVAIRWRYSLRCFRDRFRREFSSTIFFCLVKKSSLLSSTMASANGLVVHHVVDDGRRVGGRHCLEHLLVGVGGDQRAGGAQTHAAHSLDLAAGLQSALLDLAFQLRLYLLGSWLKDSRRQRRP